MGCGGSEGGDGGIGDSEVVEDEEAEVMFMAEDATHGCAGRVDQAANLALEGSH